MALEYVEVGLACDDCVLAIGSGDYSGMSDERAGEVRAGLARVGHSLEVGPERGFSWYLCRVCQSSLGGNKHEVGHFVPLRVSVRRIPLNRGGYDRTGEYFGVGLPVYHVASDYDSVNYHMRAYDRAEAILQVSEKYRGVKFTRR